MDSARAGLLAELERSNLGPRYREHFERKFEQMLRSIEFPETRQRYINAAVGPTRTLCLPYKRSNPEPEATQVGVANSLKESFMVTRQSISPKELNRVRGNQGCSAGHAPSQSPARPTSYSL